MTTSAERQQAKRRAQGEAEGRLEGLRDAICAVLRARGISPTASEEARIRASTGPDELHELVKRAVTVKTVADLLPRSTRRSTRVYPVGYSDEELDAVWHPEGFGPLFAQGRREAAMLGCVGEEAEAGAAAYTKAHFQAFAAANCEARAICSTALFAATHAEDKSGGGPDESMEVLMRIFSAKSIEDLFQTRHAPSGRQRR